MLADRNTIAAAGVSRIFLKRHHLNLRFKFCSLSVIISDHNRQSTRDDVTVISFDKVNNLNLTTVQRSRSCLI